MGLTRRQIVAIIAAATAGGGSTVALSGGGGGVGGGGGSLTVTQVLSGGGSGQGSGSGAVRQVVALQGSGAGVGSGGGTLTSSIAVPMSGGGSGFGGGSGSLRVAQALSAGGGGQGAGAGALQTAQALSGSGAGLGAGSGSLRASLALQGGGTGLGGGQGAASQAISLIGGGAGRGDGGGTLQAPSGLQLQGGGSGVGGGGGSLSVAVSLSGVGSGQGAGSGAVRTAVALQASGSGQGSGGGTITVSAGALSLVGGGSGTGSGGGSLRVAIALVAGGQGRGDGGATLLTEEPIPPTVVGEAWTIHLVDLRQNTAHLVDSRRVAHLVDLRQHTGQLVDSRCTAHLVDLRENTARLEVSGAPVVGIGATFVVGPRVPMLSTSGTPARAASTIEAGVLALGACQVLSPEPARYVPGPLRPNAHYGVETWDVIRVTDALGLVADVTLVFRDDAGPAGQVLDVPIGTDGVAALTSGGALALTATGGTGPYVWDFASNASGGSLMAGGAYVAGPLVGIDRLRVTDSLGEIGLVQAEVVAGQVVVDLAAAPAFWFGYPCIPYGKLTAIGGTAPYSWALHQNQTGATVEPAKNARASIGLQDLDGAPVDLTGWTFEAALMSQRGGLIAAGLAVEVVGGALEVDLPDPANVPTEVAILRVTATTAGATLAAGYPTTALELLLDFPEA